jgi:hypothetical protein
LRIDSIAMGPRSLLPDDFLAHRIDGPGVVDEAVGEVDGKLLAPGHHVDHSLVGGVAPGEELAGQQQAIAGLPRRDLGLGERVEVHSPARAVVERELRPIVERRRLQVRGAAAVEDEMRVARRRAVGKQRDRLGRGVGRVVDDLHVEHRRQAPESLRADA